MRTANRYLFITTWLATLTQPGIGQTNLVPNPSFEDSISCPSNWGQIANAVSWYTPAPGTPEYYHECSVNTCCSVPLNWCGYATPITGKAYSGIAVFAKTISNAREYIETQLIDTLAAGMKYCVRMHVTLADSFQYAISNISAYFSPNGAGSNLGQILTYSPQINNPLNNDLVDKTNWSLIIDSFISTGNERFITLGNFRDDPNTDTTFVSGSSDVGPYNWEIAYYYIDYIWVGLCDSMLGINEFDNEIRANLFPNPSNGEMTLMYFLSENAAGEFVIRDVLGKLISSYPLFPGDNELNIHESDLPNGVYLYEIIQNGIPVKKDKLVIAKGEN